MAWSIWPFDRLDSSGRMGRRWCPEDLRTRVETRFGLRGRAAGWPDGPGQTAIQTNLTEAGWLVAKGHRLMAVVLFAHAAIWPRLSGHSAVWIRRAEQSPPVPALRLRQPVHHAIPVHRYEPRRRRLRQARHRHDVAAPRHHKPCTRTATHIGHRDAESARTAEPLGIVGE